MQFAEDNVMYYLNLVLIFKKILKTNVTKNVLCLVWRSYMGQLINLRGRDLKR